MTDAEWTAPEVERAESPRAAGEREMLEGWLEFHRQTLLLKCTGLTAEQLRLRSTEPSTLSLLGLVRHMAEVERWWFRSAWLEEKLPEIYCTDDNRDGDFDDVDTADAEADFATFQTELELARKAAEQHSLDDTFTSRRGTQLNLRWVYVHMIEEYARHNGHADLIRERIDGTAGV
ncbi:MAG: DinB family protein [Micromonosporaceae bacterium]